MKFIVMMRKMVFSKSMKLNDRGSGVLELGQDFKYYIGKGGVLSTDFYFFVFNNCNYFTVFF